MIEQSLAPTTIRIPLYSFSLEEWRAIQELKIRYLQDHDLFSTWERERLLFIRWLFRNGRVRP
jgi:hypothetical protein